MCRPVSSGVKQPQHTAEPAAALHQRRPLGWSRAYSRASHWVWSSGTFAATSLLLLYNSHIWSQIGPHIWSGVGGKAETSNG